MYSTGQNKKNNNTKKSKAKIYQKNIITKYIYDLNADIFK